MNKVIQTNLLTEDSLRNLFEDRVLALRVSNYCAPEVASKLSEWFTNQHNLPAYTHEVYKDGILKQEYYGVYRYGLPYNKTYGTHPDSSIRQEYYQQAIPSIRSVRKACFPYLSPIDCFRLELDETWTTGAQIASYEGRKMFVGVGRVMPADDSHILQEKPHIDCLPQTIFQLDGQFSANVYLQIPDSGGALELWDLPPISPTKIESLSEENNGRTQLPEPIVIFPDEGELVLFNTRRLHAVQSFHKGMRVSIQCFIGYKKRAPLFLWC